MTISTQTKQLPDFVCKTPSIQHKFLSKHAPYQPLIAIYLLRLVIGLKNKLPATAMEELFHQDLNELTGLTPRKSSRSIDPYLEDFRPPRSTTTIYKHIKDRINELLAQGMQIDTPLFKNVQWLATELELSECDQELLVLSLLMAGIKKFNGYISSYCELSHEAFIVDYLRIMTTRPIEELEKCLDSASPLCQIGWLNVNETLDVSRLVVPPTILFTLFDEQPSLEAFRRIFFKQLKPSSLQAHDFPLLQNDLDVLIPYLQATLESRQAGVNVVIYGKQNQSKWELARLLAKCVGVPLYEVAHNHPNQSHLEPEDRFAACQLTQYWLNKKNKSALIVLDAADDVLSKKWSSDLFEDEAIVSGINIRIMKQQFCNNPLPIIWIIDTPRSIEYDCLRRFDYALEVDKMPVALRHKQITRATQALSISDTWRQQLVKQTDIPLNQINKAAKIAELNNSDIGVSTELIMEQVLNSHIHLFKRPLSISRHRPVTGYNLSFTNTTIPLKTLLAGLNHKPQGTFCFYGAPGTGKSAFAKHLAEQLGLPILIKRASDILDKYIGETEKNIADIFREANREGAILLLDEADSLLGDRRDARHNWEVSKVNEMLTQMEQFEGIFICTTNLMERMDAASLRRFDFKVKFDYLKAEQRWGLFQQESLRLGAQLPKDIAELNTLKNRIERLTQLTPGDFAVLNRQVQYQVEPLALHTMLSILEQECIAKGEEFGNIGFI